MEITYIRKGDYFYPNLALDPADQVDIGKYGRLRRRYLQEHREPLYWGMFVEGTLTQHLLEIDDAAQKQVDLTIKRLLKRHPAPNRDEDFLAYVGHMNNLTAMAEEAVLQDLIYVYHQSSDAGRNLLCATHRQTWDISSRPPQDRLCIPHSPNSPCSLYSDDEIHCEFDYAEEVNKYLRKKEKLNKMKSQSPRGLADQFINKIEAGELRLEEAKARAKEIKGYSFFLRYEKEFKSARMEYIKRGYEMMPRINFYICGLSGAGKSTLSKWLAKALFPNLEDYECYYTVGAAGVRFDEYEYQPVIIWEDVRGNELAKEYGPEGILNLMEPKPKKRSYNIKFGKITLTHQVNIITTTQPFEEFSEQVMGRNKGRNQTTQEDIEQLYRRIPVMIEISHNDIDIYRNDRAFNPQSSLKSDYKKYAVITDCSIAQLNSWWDAAPIESAIAAITEPMVELNNEFMEKMGPSGEKPSNEMDAPTFNVVKGADIQRLEWEFRQSYLTICERILTDCAYDFMPADIDFPEITMFGPYKPEPGWTLGDKFGEGPFYGVHCPFTYAQWKKMGRPMRYDNGQLYKEPYHADHERAETALEYGPYDDERTPAWVNEYKKALSAATEKYCKTKRLDDLQAWTSNLFGPHSRKDIKRVAEAWQCLVESWKTVRACFLESNECSIETTWYTTFQDLSSHCAKH